MSSRLRNLLLCICIALPLLVLVNTGQTPDSQIQQAQRLFDDGRFPEAALIYSASISRDPASVAAHVGLVRSHLKAERIDDAYRAAQAAAAKRPDASAVRAALGDVLFRQGKIAQAEVQYRAAIALNANDARAVWGLGRLLATASLRKTAASNFERAYSLDSGDADILLSWAFTQKGGERIAALERYLSNVRNAKEEIRSGVASEIERSKYFGEREAWQIVSGYQPDRIKLKNLGDPRDPIIHYGIEVRLNGDKAETFILDTGASGLTISRKVAEKHRVALFGSARASGIGDKDDLLGEQGLFEDVKIGNISFKAAVADVFPKFDSIAAGLIGTDVFEDFVLTWDFPQKELRLNPYPDGIQREPVDRVISNLKDSTTPFYRRGHGLFVHTRVNVSEPVLFAIDSGTNVNLLSSRFADAITDISRDTNSRVTGLNGRVEKVYRAEKADLQFSKWTQKNRRVVTLDLDELSESAGFEVSGILGLEVLNLFTMTIDYRNGTVDFDYKP